jgi:arylformamidase
VEIVDISQTLQSGIAVWPGDPEFSRQPVLSIVEGLSSNVSAVRMGTHTGTHIDAPLHINGSGNDVAGIPLQACIGPVCVMDFPVETCIRAADLMTREWHGVERILFRTRSSRNPENCFDRNFVHLDADAAEFLVRKGMLLVGVDAPSVDPFNSSDLPAHNILLGRGIVILEGLRLGHVASGIYNLACVPLKIAGGDGSPVRAILWQ